MSRQGPAVRKTVVQAVDLGGRVPRHAPEVERAVLASMLQAPRHIDACIARGLRPDHFFLGPHSKLAEVVLGLHQQGRPADFATVCQALRDRDWLQAVGGVAFVAQIIDSTPVVAHVEAYAETLSDLDRVRRMGEACQLAAAESFLDTGAVGPWIDSVESRVYEIASTRHAGRLEQGYEAFKGVFASLFTDEAPGVPTGFVDLDAKTSGMHDGELLIVAARPGMGKTSFVMNIATNLAQIAPDLREDRTARRPQFGVCVFSLEMPKEQLVQRTMCSEARVDASKLRERPVRLDEVSFARLHAAAMELAQAPIFFDDTPGLTVAELTSKTRAVQRGYDKLGPDGKPVQRIGAVIVDYLQLMSGVGDNREQEIASISRGLKQAAKQLRLPVIALSQLNRNTETRGGKDRRPQLSDLRESGALEQDADVIMFLFRPEYYMADKTSVEAQRVRGYAEILLAKQRNGPTGKVPVTFIEEYTRFENRARDAWRADDD